MNGEYSRGEAIHAEDIVELQSGTRERKRKGESDWVERTEEGGEDKRRRRGDQNLSGAVHNLSHQNTSSEVPSNASRSFPLNESQSATPQPISDTGLFESFEAFGRFWDEGDEHTFEVGSSEMETTTREAETRPGQSGNASGVQTESDDQNELNGSLTGSQDFERQHDLTGTTNTNVQDDQHQEATTISSVSVVGQRTAFPVLRIEEETLGTETLVFIRSMPGVSNEDFLSYRYTEVIPWLPSQNAWVRALAVLFLAAVWAFMFMEIEVKILGKYNSTVTRTVAHGLNMLVQCQEPEYLHWTRKEISQFFIENDIPDAVYPFWHAQFDGRRVANYCLGNEEIPEHYELSADAAKKVKDLFARLNSSYIDENGCIWNENGELLSITKRKFKSHDLLEFREQYPQLFDAMMAAFPFGPRSVIVGLYLLDENLFTNLFIPGWDDSKSKTEMKQPRSAQNIEVFSFLPSGWGDRAFTISPRGLQDRGLRGATFPVLPLVTLVTETIIVPEFMLMRESFFHYNEVGALIVGYLFVHFTVSVYNGLKWATGLHVLSNPNYSIIYYYSVRTLAREVNSLIIFGAAYAMWSYCNEWVITGVLFFLMLWKLLEFIDIVAAFFSETVAVFLTMRLYKRVVLSVRPFRKVVLAQTV